MRTVIYESEFQPFESRQGVDTVIKLQFNYDPDLIALLKRSLKGYRQYAIDPSRQIFQPGGWRPDEKCWFVERSIWPMVMRDLEASGYEVVSDEAVA